MPAIPAACTIASFNNNDICRTVERVPFLLPVALAAACLLASCAHQSHEPKPLDAEAIVQDFSSRTAQSAGLQEIAIWDLATLTQAALKLHPDMQVARARWLEVKAGEQRAGQKANPEISFGGDHHSQAEGVSPWSFKLGIGIPIVTSGKREARMAQSAALSEAARLDIAQTAWQVYSRLRSRLLDIHAVQSAMQGLWQEMQTRAEIVAMLEKRLDVGYAGNLDVADARLQLRRVEIAYENEKARLAEGRAALAAAVGLPESAIMPERLLLAGFGEIPTVLPTPELQRAALQNRLDIRRGLAEYAAAEAEVRLEIARQTPDITLGPTYEWDQGDNRWGLGLSLVLALFHNNDAGIAAANARRETQAARFYQLQAQVIGWQEQAQQGLQAALEKLENIRKQLKEHQSRFAQQQKLFEAGQTDRLDLTLSKLELHGLEAAVAAALVSVHKSHGLLEDAVQQPLDGSPDFSAGALPGTEDE